MLGAAIKCRRPLLRGIRGYVVSSWIDLVGRVGVYWVGGPGATRHTYFIIVWVTSNGDGAATNTVIGNKELSGCARDRGSQPDKGDVVTAGTAATTIIG